MPGQVCICGAVDCTVPPVGAGLAIRKVNKETPMWRNETDKRIYRTADGKAVDEGHPDAAFLLVGPGGELPDDEAKSYGLLAEAKAVEAPPENKARGRAEAK